MSLISDCQILNNSLAAIPCLGRVHAGQTRLRLYNLLRAEGPKTLPYPAAHPRMYSPYRGVPP